LRLTCALLILHSYKGNSASRYVIDDGEDLQVESYEPEYYEDLESDEMQGYRQAPVKRFKEAVDGQLIKLSMPRGHGFFFSKFESRDRSLPFVLFEARRFGKRSPEISDGYVKRYNMDKLLQPRFGKRRAGFPLFNVEVKDGRGKRAMFTNTPFDFFEGKPRGTEERGIMFGTHPYLRFASKRSFGAKRGLDEMIRPRFGKRGSSMVENMIRPRFGKRFHFGRGRSNRLNSVFSNYSPMDTYADFGMAFLPEQSNFVYPSYMYSPAEEQLEEETPIEAEPIHSFKAGEGEKEQ